MLLAHWHPSFLFGNKNYFPVNIVANITTQFIEIQRKCFSVSTSENTRILQVYLNLISNRAQFLSKKIRFLNFKTIKGKLAIMLLLQIKQGSDTIQLKLSQ